MKIAFVHVPVRHHGFSENLKVVDEEFTFSPPIVLAYVAAIAEKAGSEVILIDAAALKLSKEQVRKKLEIFKPDFMAFRLDTYCFHDTLDWIRFLKKAIGVPVIAGGINFSLYPRETMSYPEIDFGFTGEAVETLPEFLEIFPRGNYEHIAGLCRRDKKGEVFINPANLKLVDFDSYPFPARHLLPNHLYHSFVSQRKNFTIMLTSTGCPYRCTFCAIAGLKHYRERSAESVLAEIEKCYYDFDVREIDFFDATFFINKKRCLKIFEGIIKRKLDINWTCRSRVDVVDEEILRAAKESGLRMVFWGIESGNAETLECINKEIDLSQTAKAIAVSRKLGIRNLGFLMAGNPGETAEDAKETVKWAKKLKLDYVQICRTIPKPGAKMHLDIVKETGYDYWREFVLGRVEEKRIYVSGIALSQREVESLLKKMYYCFYFRPAFILRTLTQVRSFGEFARYVKVALRMIRHWFYTDTRPAKTDSLKKSVYQGDEKI